MKNEFENSISFLCRLTDIKIAWINPWDGVQLSQGYRITMWGQFKFYL